MLSQQREQLEAEAAEMLARLIAPRTPDEAAAQYAENLRRMGVPAIHARVHGGMLVATVAVPRGQG